MKPFLPDETVSSYVIRVWYERRAEVAKLPDDLLNDLKQVTMLCVYHNLISEGRGREILSQTILEQRAALQEMEGK